MPPKFDFIVVGAGIIGLAIARSLRAHHPDAQILVLEKEPEVANHASGRNSGVLHAGFYYTADSFKARFTVIGNKLMKAYCRDNQIPVNECGKIVVAQNDAELKVLGELLKRGQANGSNVAMIDALTASKLEPNIKTHKKALLSPDTASVDPKQVCLCLKDTLITQNVHFHFNTAYLGHKNDVILTNKGEFSTRKLINCAGLYADKIAQDFGFGKKYTMIPFKGLYLKYTKNSTDIKTNIYPVPNLKNPFLGVHFTKTVHNDIKIGPTAIPSFWRENYAGMENFKFKELWEIACQETKLFFTNSFNFRDLAFEEMRKYYKPYFVGLAEKLVQSIDPAGFTEYTDPGIRSQLMDKATLSLVQDFVIEGDSHSVHVLNAVSPAFTCAFPFADFVVQDYVNK